MSRGSVLAEFAIASIVLLTIMFGIVDFGRALYTYHGVSNAARLATRYAIVHGASSCPGGTPSPDPLQAYVAGQLPGIDPSPGALSVTTTCGDVTGCFVDAAPYNAVGCNVSVTVAYRFHFLTPFVSGIVPAMTSTSTMVISQ